MATTAKTHPWRVMLHRDVVSKISGFDIPQSKGERMCRRLKDAQAFVDAMREEHGEDAVSDAYKA